MDPAANGRVGRPEDVLERLGGATSVILTTHLNADGDGAGSEVALASFLRARGVEAWIVNPTPFPKSYGFLLPDPSWAPDAGSAEAAALAGRADLGVVLDTGVASRVGRVMALIDRLPLLVIDHHQPGDDVIDGLVFRDPTASATGELVYEIIAAADGPWSRQTVDGLYVAILTDTGGFRFSNSTSRCFQVASRLVELGADPEALHREVYGRFPERRYRLLREALGTLRVHESGAVAWMTVPQEAYAALGANAEDLEGFVDVPRSLEGVEVALLFRMTADGRIKVSLRSTGEVDVNSVAADWGGGGHVKASGALLQGSLDQVVETVVDRVVAAVAGAGPSG